MLLCYPVTTSEPDRAGIYHAGLAGAARRQFLGEFHREEPVERRRSGGEQAPMSRERAVTRYQGDVRVYRPRPQALHVLLVGTRSQAYLWRYWFRWTEWRLSSKSIIVRQHLRRRYLKRLNKKPNKRWPILFSSTIPDSQVCGEQILKMSTNFVDRVLGEI